MDEERINERYGREIDEALSTIEGLTKYSQRAYAREVLVETIRKIVTDVEISIDQEIQSQARVLY